MKIKFKYLPNILTVSRLISCPILIYLFYSYPDLLKNNILTLIILIIFLTACITDFLDGYLARNYNLESRLGKVLDPIADKALIITISILLIIYAKDLPQLPFFIIMLREIIVLSLRYDLNNVEQSINVNMLSKCKTVIQMIAIASIFIYYIYGIGKYSYFIEHVSFGFLWFASIITIISGIHHFKTYLKLRKK
tara:strand:- start:7879 stop:8460 length:582 start_codon:yes stop_codon:yes gene_type:complete